jgi:hypothetical protein
VSKMATAVATILSFQILFLFFTPHSSSAKPCIPSYDNSESHRKIREKINQFRTRKLKQSSFQELLVNGIAYQVVGELGTGSSTVYLARTASRELVSIKRLTEEGNGDHWVNSLYYEKTVTQFYIEKGLKVPKIIDSQVVREGRGRVGYLVKEYREGLTLEESLYEASFLRGDGFSQIRQSLHQEVVRVTAIHSEFRAWLEQNHIDLFQHPLPNLNLLIDQGDFGGAYKNWLYDAELLKWIIFDP